MAGQRPCFHAAIAQIARELGGESMQREHALRLDKIDIAQQIVVIGVIGKREGGVDLITIDGVRIDRPAADHGDAFARNFLEHARTVRARRTNQDFAGDFVRVVAHVFAKRLAELLVDARHLKDGAVQHRRETGAVERAKNFLRFAERITEQHRNFAFIDRLATERDDLIDDLLGGRKAVARQTVGRFHDQACRPGAIPPARRICRDAI